MRGVLRLFVVAITIVTLTLAAAVGVSARSGTFGSSHAVTSSVVTGQFESGFLNDAARFLSSNGGDKETGQCHPPKKTHENGTPGHKNHPCGDKDGDTD
jgi:hypothetical protein